MNRPDFYLRPRKCFVAAFEVICILGVYIAVGVGAITVGIAFQHNTEPGMAIVIAIACYAAAIVIFGGALTLIDIARSLERLVAMQAGNATDAAAVTPSPRAPAVFGWTPPRRA